METFRVNKNTEIICNYGRTRNGFKHTATLLINGRENTSTKVCYLNRTWESFTYETVIKRLLETTNILSKSQKTRFLNKISGNAHKKVATQFKTIGTIAKMGELFCDTPKEKNDWKERMIKAGLGNKGLIMPENWNCLNEEDKESRLNFVIDELSKD